MEEPPVIIKQERIRPNILRPQRDVVEAYKELPDVAGLIARILDQVGVSNTIPSNVLRALKPGSVLVGPAVTVRNLPVADVPYRSWHRGTSSVLGERDAFFVAQTGDVVVIDGTSVFPASSLGSMSVTLAARLGVAGVVVAGAVTGVKGIQAAPIPVWAAGGTTITGHHRVETIEINGPIGIHNLRVEPGDLVVADDSGVTIVPSALVEQVLARARRVVALNGALKTTLQSDADREALRTALSVWWKDYARLGSEP